MQFRLETCSQHASQTFLQRIPCPLLRQSLSRYAPSTLPSQSLGQSTDVRPYLPFPCACACGTLSGKTSWRTAWSEVVQARRQRLPRLAASSEAVPAMTASTIVEEFYAVQQPATYNIRYSEALKAFARSAILAYECGYSEDMIQHELDGLQSHQGRDSTDCTVFLSLVWITIMLAPNKSIRRWVPGAPVSDATLATWKGFVGMIVDGWFEKRWAWYPINRLQMELSVATGRSEKPAIVAEMARIVYTTLESVAPQFPSM